jgi:putative nucleotidyltransferase with HDIG domain
MKKMHTVPDKFMENPLWIRIVIPVLCVLIFAGAILLPILLANDTQLITEDVRTRYTVGSLAENDVRAKETFHYIDEGETRRQQVLAAKSVLPHFHISMIESRKMLAMVDALFVVDAESEQLLVDGGFQDIQAILESIRMLPEDTRKTLHEFLFDQEELMERQDEGYEQVMVYNVVGDQLETSAKIRDMQGLQHQGTITSLVNSDLRSLRYLMRGDIQSLAFDILSTIIRPNVYYSPIETAIARERASRDVIPSMVRVEKGQYILKTDFVITNQDIKTLQAMRMASAKYTPTQLIGRIFFVLITTTSALYSLYMVFEYTKRKFQFILLFLVGVLFTQITTYLVLLQVAGKGFVSLDPFLPVFTLPITFALVTNRKRAGMIAAILLGSYAILLPSSTETTVFFIIAVSFCGIYFIRYASRRIDMVFQWFFGIVAASFFVLFNNLINGYGFDHVLSSIFAVSANISATYILVTLFLPLIELGFNIPTSFRLRELAFSDSPALVRLSQTAVGTYNHSMIVAEMAYSAAKEIGADPLLARVAGLYHDIGKQEHPEYFIENQNGDNKHDDLKASLSVAIIKSHVKIGVEKGREAHLPQEVLDIISQHHGNDIIAIFLKEAQVAAAADSTASEVKRQDYAYHNQIPQTPEAAIVMLADSVEAASRTIKKPSAQKYDKLVNQIIMAKIERKQLSSSRLSMTDLDTITKVFVQILTGRFHTRIEYPDDTKEENT